MGRTGRGLFTLYNEFIMKTERDVEILRVVKQFQQATSAQIKQLVFSDVTETPVSRALRRLVESKHLVRVGRKLIQGLEGGSGAYVYSLGRASWPMFYTGRYKVRTAVYPHMLDIVDAYVALTRQERAGTVQILKVKAEPATSVTVGGQLLKPDLYVKYRIVASQRVVSLWLEIDKGTEHRGQMTAMFERYRQAYLNFDDELQVFPLTLVLVRSELRQDDERVDELRRLLRRIPDDETRALFRVEKLDDFPQAWML